MEHQKLAVWTRYLVRKVVAYPATGCIIADRFAEKGNVASVGFECPEIVFVCNIDVRDQPLAREIDQLPIGIEDGKRADIGHATRLVAQLDVHRVTLVLALDRFTVDDRKSGQIVVEVAFDGLHGGEGLLDLLCDNERRVRQGLRIFRHGPRAQVVGDQTGAGDDDQCKRDRAGYDHPHRAEKIQRRRCRPVALLRVLRGCKSGYPTHFEAMSRLRKTRRSLYGVANANNLIIPFSMRFRRVICDNKESIG